MSSSEPSESSEPCRSPAAPEPPPAFLSSVLPPAPSPFRFPVWLPPLLYLLLSMLFLWRCVFGGQVFLPAGILGSVAPYHGVIPASAVPPWNPLRWDGIAQFYPWRHFYAESLRSGTVPLWNPFQFCGTPFVANSQSAVFYPPNLVFALLPTARAFGVNAVLHLTACGWFTFLLLKRFRLFDLSAFAGGVIFAFSAWQVQWLQLPTFLATSCWIPLVLAGVHRAFSTEGRVSGGATAALLGGSLGAMLLAGHLQIAFYGLLAGTLLTLTLAFRRWRQTLPGVSGRGVLLCAASLAMGGMLCAPQLLPALELSRVSHRAGRPTAEGYAAYTEYALPPAGLVTLTLPNFFGNDYDEANPYWGFYEKHSGELAVPVRHNAAETALYVGIVPLLLALLGGLRGARGLKGRTGASLSSPLLPALFFVLLALLSLLMALGTPVDALFYFGVPGFGQSGSPGRVLCLWALGGAGLAAFGLESLLGSPLTKREGGTVLLGFVFVLAAGVSFSAKGIAAVPGELLRGSGIPTLGDVFGRIGEDGLRLLIFGGGGAALLLFSSRARHRTLFGAGIVLLCGLDLASVGIRVNPTALPEWVYPPTSLTDTLRRELAHERVFPVNQTWSLYRAPDAVLPPNGAMVYGLHDPQGYDSLLTGEYKAFANSLAFPNRFGGVDASPPEVGNLVFTQNPLALNAPLTGAKFVLYSTQPAVNPNAPPRPAEAPVFGEGDTLLYPMPHARPRAQETASGGGFAVEWLEDGPTRVRLKTPNLPLAGTVTLQDGFYPGWKASVDGRETPVLRQNGGPFREVSVSPGAHTVIFAYRPASFRLGLFLMGVSGACLAACGVSAGVSRLPRKKERSA